MTHIKKLRLAAGLTQVQVAQAVGIAQPTYQRWESGAAPIPTGKLKKLAKALDVSPDEVLGKRKPFDLFGIDPSVEDDRKYFGETAIHFTSGRGSILLPISEGARLRLSADIQGEELFLAIESLDNRTVFVRREAIADLYLSSEAFDTFGPEKYDDYIGLFPDDDFWQIVADFDDPSDHEETYGEKRVEEVIGFMMSLQEGDPDSAASDPNALAAEARQAESVAEFQKFIVRASHVTWQLSSGQLRSEPAFFDDEVYEAFYCLEMDIDDEPIIYLPLEGYHQTVYIRKAAIDYISVPTHMMRNGMLASAEREIDDEMMD